MSWDRFGQFTVGTFNVKLPVIAFALTFALTAIDSISHRRRGPQQTALITCAFVILAAMSFMGIFSEDVLASQLQAATVLVGAIIPLCAVYWNLQIFPNTDRALSAVIRGGYFSGIFGVYQLLAFYTNLPQVIPYEALGGGLGRISSFSYEAGYFGYFLILVIAALFARAFLRSEPVGRIPLFFLLSVLVLSNTRATFFTLPLFFLLLFARWPANIRRPKLWPIVSSAVLATGIAVAVSPALLGSFLTRFASIFDPTEISSNAPRLSGYAIQLHIVQDHPLAGIGAGNLYRVVSEYGGVANGTLSSNGVVANNMWIQALLDGGLPLLALETTFVLMAVRIMFRRRNPAVRMIMSGWISVALVSSLITSLYFDVKVWAILGICLGISSQVAEAKRGAREVASSRSWNR
ncbi:O-antigen ligase family protein [Cryobacterium sp. MDB2-33-2]|uniref:O-antigen ligase family protein n=1 Tax=Cryobacterium sp. MDB2-33-2 TaxID=1259179 RepID=UPI00141B4A68|nr:O-antigen ligase family protein [Cryobacterium sp. MDB2-33-2]